MPEFITAIVATAGACFLFGVLYGSRIGTRITTMPPEDPPHMTMGTGSIHAYAPSTARVPDEWLDDEWLDDVWVDEADRQGAYDPTHNEPDEPEPPDEFNTEDPADTLRRRILERAAHEEAIYYASTGELPEPEFDPVPDPPPLLADDDGPPPWWPETVPWSGQPT